MSGLFFRTFSQGLQAFTPIVAALLWCDATGARRIASAVRRGLYAAVPLSIVAGMLFQASTRRALDEAVLAICALVITLVSTRQLMRTKAAFATDPTIPALWSAAVSAVLIVVRQMMEAASSFDVAAIQLRSFEATAAIASAVVMAGALAWSLFAAGRRIPGDARFAALSTFCRVFLALTSWYAFHESAEARLLPWSEVLHAATEPYGPDGLYGMHFSDLLVVAPAAAASYVWANARGLLPSAVRPRQPVRMRATGFATMLALVFVMGIHQSDARAPQAGSHATTEQVAAATARPHLLFRRTSAGPSFGSLAIVPLDAPGSQPVALPLTCQRLSFARGNGLCLHLERGIFNRYTAIVLDNALKPGAAVKLQGLPSRTRVSPDGRVGAVTVFVTGDDYAADFSTRTTIIDLAGGDEIGELEQFSTWKDGERFRAVDFNFWGVTFAPDGNTFYAALRTAGKTYLVRGELALRRLTVMRENVECPSLSPNNRLLAYKKRVGPSPDSWRLHVLDLQTGAERPVAGEARYIDDQVEWLDDRHLLYGIPRRTTSIVDVWVAAVDNAELARVFLAEAESPIVVR